MIAVYSDELDAYSAYPTIEVPLAHKGIGNKRHYLVSNSPDPHVVLMDDDLVFAARRQDERSKFSPATHSDMEDMFTAIEYSLLAGWAHGAVAMREGGNRDTDEFRFNSRALRCHFYHAGLYNEHGIRFDRMEFMEDFDVTLQFMEAGHPNIILNEWVHNQSGSNTSGGCSQTRTLEKQGEAAEELARLHAPFVKVVEKTTKGSWGGGTRKDVTIYWKKKAKAFGANHG
jgi:hypothetical protein